ncbi:MAG: hypothetical protein GTN81_07795 [Proteobacteria bacterium]|nr:hypothetical protein [Pseudomonadota bacterium]
MELDRGLGKTEAILPHMALVDMTLHKAGETPVEINLDKETIKGIASGPKERSATIGLEFGQ